MLRNTLIVALAVSTLAACQATPAPSALNPVIPVATSHEAVLLRGRVSVPGYQVLAEPSDLVSQATVSLLLNGVTVAAGVTDLDGAFTLYRSTTPLAIDPGDQFVLAVMKRVDVGTDVKWLSMRTLVEKTAEGWTSITGSEVVVSMATSAIARLVANDPGLTFALVRGVVDPVTAAVAPFGTYDQTEVLAYAQLLTERLRSGLDPAAPLVYADDVDLWEPSQLEALYFYDTIDGYLWIRKEYTGTTVELPNLKCVTDFISVGDGNTTLLNLDGLSALEEAHSIEVIGTSLTSLSGLRNLKRVTSSLRIQRNAGLEALHLPESLTEVGTLWLSDNGNLQEVTASSALTFERLIFRDNHPDLVNPFELDLPE